MLNKHTISVVCCIQTKHHFFLTPEAISSIISKESALQAAEHGASSIECLSVYMVYWQSCYFSIRNSRLQIIQKMVHRFLYQHNPKTVLGCRVISTLDFWTVAILSDPMFVNCFWILAILSICKNCQLVPLFSFVFGIWNQFWVCDFGILEVNISRTPQSSVGGYSKPTCPW